MTNFYRVITTSPKAFIIHTEDELRAKITAQHLNESFPYTEFTYEKGEGFFDLPDANHFILDAVRVRAFEKDVDSALAAIRANIAA